MVAQDNEFLAHGINKLAVVGDKDDGWWVRARVAELEEMTLQPDDAEKVKEVGRFIELRRC